MPLGDLRYNDKVYFVEKRNA